MSAIRDQSFKLAQEEACRLWAYCGAQYFENDLLLKEVSLQILKSLSVFALSARRVLESFDKTEKFSATSSPWDRSSSVEGLETDLWECLNLAIHAHQFQICFSPLVQGTYIAGAKVVSHAALSTDMKCKRAISPFAMAYAFLAEVVPRYEQKHPRSVA